MAFCSWQDCASTCCFILCSVLCRLLCDALPFSITVTCRRAAYPRPAICVCLCASDCFLIRKTLIYSLPCSLQCALQYCLSSLPQPGSVLACPHWGSCLLCWLERCLSCWCWGGRWGMFYTWGYTGFSFSPVSHSTLKCYFLDSSLLLPSIKRDMFDAWSAWKMMLLCYMLKHMT